MDKEKADRALFEFADIANELKVTWFLTLGTCLGFVRDGGYIKGDDDIDLGVKSERQALKEFFARLEARGFKKEQAYLMLGNEVNQHFFKYGILLDIFVTFLEKERQYFDSFDEVEYEGRKFRVPHPVEAYLTCEYGDWRIPGPKLRGSEGAIYLATIWDWIPESATERTNEILPEVSIIVTCVDMLETTKKCVEAYWNNTPPIFELIIVAQAPGDEMLKWLESLKQENKAKVITFPKPLGTAGALNVGFRNAKGKYVFSMSNSNRATRGWLYPLLDTLDAHPEYGWVCCKEIRGETIMNLNASALFSKEALFKVGLFDEEYSQGIGFEDDDLLRRFWKAGYEPHGISESVIVHEPGGGKTYGSIYSPQEMQERFIRNQALFYRKWGETGTDWGRTDLTVATIDPNDVVQEMHRIDWIKSKVRIEDTILEVGVAENPVWAGTQFKVTTLDKSVRPEEQCFPDVVGEAENLRFDANRFDVVALGELLEHVPEPQIVLREAARVARKKVIVTVPDEYSWPDECKPFWNPGHVRFYTYSTFQDELKKLGLPFKIWNVKFRGWSHWCAEIYCNNKPEKPRLELTGGKAMIEQTKKLNIGSFTVMLPPPDWINLDILDISDYAREKGFNFQQVDVTKELPFEDNSIDFINCSHLIEHLTVEEGIAFLKEMFRVLRPNCTVRIGTPDLNKLINAYQRGQMSEFDSIQPEEYQQSPTQTDKFWRLLTAGHKTCYDLTAIRHSLEKAGFKSIILPAYNEELDMFPKVSLYVEAEKQSALPEIEPSEKAEEIPTSQPPEGIPEYWRRFATRDRMGRAKLGLDRDEEKKEGLVSKILCISTAIYPVSAELRYGGIERLCFLTSEELNRRGFKVSVAAPEGSSFPKGVIHINTGPCGDFIEGERKAHWHYNHLLNEFDAVISFDHRHFAMLGRDLPAIALIWHTPSIMQFPLPSYNIASLSEFQKRELQQYQGLKSRIIDPHCVNPTTYLPQENDNGRYLFIGRLNPEKGVRDAITLCREMGVGLDIIGGLAMGDPPEYLEWVEGNCDPEQIVYHGNVSDKVKFEFIAKAKALLHTVNYPEVSSHKSIEAMCGGLPIIAYDIGANVEIIEHEVTGFIARDENDFKECMAKAGDLNKDLIRERALKRWAVEATVDRFILVLREVAGGLRW